MPLEWVKGGKCVKSAVLQCLKEHRANYLSGGDIGRRLGISRAAVWKHVSALREEGYEIEARSRRGYRLTGAPDLLLPDEVQADLATTVMGCAYHHYHRVSSTNDVARDLASKGAPEGTVVVAEEQSGGRGRLGRGWHSPPGGLWVSVILRPAVAPVRAPEVTFMTAVACVDALRSYPGLEAGVKWPNDLLWEGRKLGGILTEMTGEFDRVNYMAVGIGLNVNLAPADFPPELRARTTSLSAITGFALSRRRLLRELLAALDHWYGVWTAEGFVPVRGAWERVHRGANRPVRVAGPQGDCAGVAVGVDVDGALLVRTASGRMERVLAGDVLFEDGDQA